MTPEQYVRFMTWSVFIDHNIVNGLSMSDMIVKPIRSFRKLTLRSTGRSWKHFLELKPTRKNLHLVWIILLVHRSSISWKADMSWPCLFPQQNSLSVLYYKSTNINHYNIHQSLGRTSFTPHIIQPTRTALRGVE